MTDAKIKELEGQLLALREAVREAMEWNWLIDEEDEPPPHVSQDLINQALTDTAQAGREAEARIIERLAGWMESTVIFTNTVASRAVRRQIDRLREEANRLRNGGSDGE